MSHSSVQPLFSLIVPTRERVKQLGRLLASLAETASHPEQLEVILVVDEDDAPSQRVCHDTLHISMVLVPPRQTMGALNMAGYEASTGRYVMLLNDDVVARTPGWDERMLSCFQKWVDDIVLVHVNDLLFGADLCTFPVVTRRFGELAGGICPREYVRYRIDDHISDLFNLLAVLGERRTHYLPDVVFEHFNYQAGLAGDRHHHVDQAVLALDAQRFEDLFPERKELALKLKEHIDDVARSSVDKDRRQLLDSIRDPFSLRVPQRLRVGSDPSVAIGVAGVDLSSEPWQRCLSSLRSCAGGREIIVCEHRSTTEFHLPRALNHLLDVAQSDLVALIWSPIAVEPGWLDGLCRSWAADVGVIAPSRSGVVFKPDRSGHFSPIQNASKIATAAFSFAGPVALIDSRRCGRRFDETYGCHFFDVDFGLRTWQSGLRVVAAPDCHFETLPADDRIEPEALDADRRLFVDRWWHSGAIDGLERDVWRSNAELRQFAEIWHRAEELLSPRPGEAFAAFTARVDDVVKELRPVPLYEAALMDRAEHLLGDREPAATDQLDWLLGVGGRHPVFVERHGDYRIELCGQFHASTGGESICSAPTLSELRTLLDAGHVRIPGPPLGRLAVKAATTLFAKARDVVRRIRRRFGKDGFGGLARALGRRLGV